MNTIREKLARRWALSSALALAPPAGVDMTPPGHVDGGIDADAPDEQQEPKAGSEGTLDPSGRESGRERPLPSGGPEPAVSHASTVETVAEPPPPRLARATRTAAVEGGTLPVGCRRGKYDLCRQRTISGAVLTAVGIAALGSGIGLMPLDDKAISDSPAFLRTYRPAGVVLIGAGILAVTMGAVLIADAVQRRKGTAARFARRNP
ncbi:MAG: hypothetical protein H7138_15005 [Myxococcales bacterium]|nr:hypothetical protein [Myxococcales bacterium]